MTSKVTNCVVSLSNSISHSVAGWGTDGSVQLQTVDLKSVLSRGRQQLIALRCLLLMLVSTPPQIVSRCCSGV